MKTTRGILIIIAALLVAFSSKSQKLTLTDLENICNKSNWEYVNQYLLKRGWEFYESKKGNTSEYNTIVWSFDRGYKDEAAGWIQLYTYEGLPNKIFYSTFNKESYSSIQTQLATINYKLSDSWINDNEITSAYASSKFLIEITTSVSGKESHNVFDESITSYTFLMIKKSSIYDPYNGLKKEYYDGKRIKAEYSLKDGELNGEIKTFYENGQLQKKGYYSNGKANGKFTEYDKYGNVSAVYFMQNDMQNGIEKTYEDGMISYTTYYKNDLMHGQHIKYYYDENKNLFLKLYGKFANDKQDGSWRIYSVEDNEEKLISFENYSQGILDGAFQLPAGDSLKFGSYNNGVLDGPYLIYLDLKRWLIGGIISTDTSKMNLICKGKYRNGLKSGNWNIYNMSGTLSEKGRYLEGEKDGLWSYYYDNYFDLDGIKLPYSGELFLTEYYRAGKKEGQSIQYSVLEEQKYICDTSEFKHVNPIDTCSKDILVKQFLSVYYKNDEFHGPCLLKDSTGKILFEGDFIYGDKDGEWLESYTATDSEDNLIYIFERGNYFLGERTGEWKEFIIEDFTIQTSNYSKGKLNGKMVRYLSNGNPSEIKFFKDNLLKELSVYDSVGENVLRKYKFLSETDDYITFKKINYSNDSTSSSEYWMKKSETEMDHRLFEFLLYFQTSKFADGQSCYLDGEYKLQNKDDDVEVSGQYLKNKRSGIWKFNFHDQNIQIQVEFLDGVPRIEKYYFLNSGDLYNGIFKVYQNDSQPLMEERKIKKGLRNGLTIYYNSTGEIIKREKYKNGIMK